MPIVELEKGVYIAPWSGDPGRTIVKDNAQVFATEKGAKISLAHARRHRAFPDAVIVNLDNK